VDPIVVAACIALSMAGCLLGIVSGLIPGIHVNTLAALLLASYPSIEAALPLEPEASAVAVACCVMSASVVHSFLDFVPSVFIGAPDSEDAISVLPGHRLLLAGRGMEAVRAAAIGSLVGCSAAVVLAVPLQWVLIHGADELLSMMTPAVLVVASMALVIGEIRRGTGAWGPFLFILSGLLGLGCMVLPIGTEGIIGGGSVMMPLLTGLFGIPVMISGSSGGRVPPQTDRIRDPVGLRPGLKGIVMGTAAGWFPGITSTVGASLSAMVLPERRASGFISMVASIGSVTAVLSLVTLSVSGSGRSGTALVIGEIIGDSLSGFATHSFMMVLLSAALGSLAGYVLTIMFGKLFSGAVEAIDQRTLSRTVLLALIALTIALTGPSGLLVLIISASVGMIPRYAGTGRIILCGCLILPVLVFKAGLFRSLRKLGRSLRHELIIVDHESLVRP